MKPSAARGSAPDPEGELLLRARAGDRDAFALLHARYARVVHAILLARVSREEADDLVQDVFLTALNRIHDVREEGAFGPWLCAIARNRATDALRRQGRFATLTLEPAYSAPPHQQAREALDAIRALPPAFGETLMMRLVEGLNGPEIALRTGMTEGSVRVNLHRGMALLRQKLEAP